MTRHGLNAVEFRSGAAVTCNFGIKDFFALGQLSGPWRLPATERQPATQAVR